MIKPRLRLGLFHLRKQNIGRGVMEEAFRQAVPTELHAPANIPGRTHRENTLIAAGE
jgi:hypothetical protein